MTFSAVFGRTLVIALCSLSFIISSASAQTSISFNGIDQYIEMTPWEPTGEYKIIAWLGELDLDDNEKIFFAVNSESNAYISLTNTSIQYNYQSSHPGIWNKFNFAETRYLEVHVKKNEMTASDGTKTATVKNSSITPTGNMYDTLFKRGSSYSKGALQAVTFMDLNDLENSRTIAFDENGSAKVTANFDVYVGINNITEDSLDHDQSVPSPNIEQVQSAVELGEMIENLPNGMPLINLDPTTDDLGKLYAWQGHYWIRTYLNLYEATEDLKYLNWAVDLVEEMLDNTDEARAVRYGLTENTYKTAPKFYLQNRNYFGPGWTQQYKTNGLSVLTDGMIVNAIMRVVDTIRSNEIGHLKKQAQYYTAVSKRIVDSHSSSWSENRQATIAGSWYYTVTNEVPEGHSGLYSNPLSYNHSLTMATAMLLIDKWTGGNDIYRSQLTLLETFFRDHVRFNNDGTCDWDYSWYKSNPTRSEDINHGHLDVGYFVLAEEEGYLQSDDIPRCMAKTIVETVAIGPALITHHVDGFSISPSSEQIALSYDYRELAKFEPSITARSNNSLRQHAELKWYREYAALSEVFVD